MDQVVATIGTTQAAPIVKGFPTVILREAGFEAVLVASDEARMQTTGLGVVVATRVRNPATGIVQNESVMTTTVVTGVRSRRVRLAAIVLLSTEWNADR